MLPISSNPPSGSHEFRRVQLRRLLARCFSLEELKTFAFDLGVDFDELGGETKTLKIRELILCFERQSKLETLIAAAEVERPDIHWPRYTQPGAMCPYRGLAPFEEGNAALFFGREQFTQQLITAVHQRALVALVGSSGSGKSSVVFAGLLPHLRRQGDWIITSCRPGTQPFHELSKALIPLLEADRSEVDRLAEINKLRQMLQQREISLADVLHRILQKHADKNRLLLVVDQFEELYTSCPDVETRQQFLDMLLMSIEYTRSITLGQSAFTCVLTLRGDFMGHALAYRPLADALQKSDVKLGPMTRDELETAIRRPAKGSGLTFDDGLVERILDDIIPGGLHQLESGNLPLLEFALEQLWELRTTDGHLTHAAYETIGEVGGAISRYADEIYEGLTPLEQANIRWVLVQMVHLGDIEDTRRLVTRREIGITNWPLVKQLAEERLVITDQDATGQEIAEVIHEALIQRWGRMQDWMKQDRPFRTWQDHMRASLARWQKSRADDDLLRGTLLSLSQEWLQKKPESLNQEEIEYIQRSVAVNKIRKTRLVVFLVMAGSIGAAIAAASIAAPIGYLLGPPPSTQVPIPRFAYAFLFGLQCGLIGGLQGCMTTLGLLLADALATKPSRYGRALGGMALGGITGGLLFLLLKAAESLPPQLSYSTVFVVGFVASGLSSGAACLVVPEGFGKPDTLLLQTVKGALAAGTACFVAMAVLYSLIDVAGADAFLLTALAFTALESMFGGGFNFGLGMTSRLRYSWKSAPGDESHAEAPTNGNKEESQ